MLFRSVSSHDINGDTTAALGLTNATEVATYLNNNFFNLAGGGGGGSLPDNVFQGQ